MKNRAAPGTRFFIVEENLERYLTDRANRNGYLWFFFPVVIGGFFPWLLFAGRPVRAAMQAARARADHAALVPLLAAGFGFVFFSISRSQLPPYMTPIAPAIAALAGIGLRLIPQCRRALERAAAARRVAGLWARGRPTRCAWRGARHPRRGRREGVKPDLACGAVCFPCGGGQVGAAAPATRRGRSPCWPRGLVGARTGRSRT